MAPMAMGSNYSGSVYKKAEDTPKGRDTIGSQTDGADLRGPTSHPRQTDQQLL